MKFNTKQDVEAPVAFVFAYLTDFDFWERSAMRRGAQVQRHDNADGSGVGMSWAATFPFRGKARNVTVTVLQLAGPNKLKIGFQSPAIEGFVNADLVEMSAKRTRMHITLEFTPRNLTARLFVQSMRLARARLNRKYAMRVTQLTTDLEQAFQQAQTS
jgi:uncharacterized membrane-anchored protein